MFRTHAPALALIAALTAAPALAETPMVEAADQSVANGVVSAEMVRAPANGWLVVHRTDAEMKPGPVVGYAPLRAGDTSDVAALLSPSVLPAPRPSRDGRGFGVGRPGLRPPPRTVRLAPKAAEPRGGAPR